ncbi:HAD family hydrolase [Flavobacterium sp.]|uniref:HAD family hydrolase n=1 Tax=Flavobacterium sp. TaxID=239 RepID=UPI0035B4830B
MSTTTIVFDLDDTLVKEIDFLKSAFFEIANSIEAEVSSLYHQMLVWYFDNENVFQKLVQLYPDLSMDLLKSKYRHHQPNFEKYSYVKDFLSELKQNRYRIGLITDGFSITQRNKISSLGIGGLFDLIVISEEFGSEKPNEENYKVFHQFNSDTYYYVGDNLKKDFVTPNKLGWITICLLDDGNNIHSQNFDTEEFYLPKYKIKDLSELLHYI